MKKNDLENTIAVNKSRLEELKRVGAGENSAEEIKSLEASINKDLQELEGSKINAEIAAIDETSTLSQVIENAIKADMGIGLQTEILSQEAEVLKQELESLEDPLEEILEKEIDPLLKIFWDEQGDFSAYREEMMETFFSIIEKKNRASGPMPKVLSIEETSGMIKELIHSQAKAALEDVRNYESKKEVDPHVVRAARILLLTEGDHSDLKKDSSNLRSVEGVYNYLNSYNKKPKKISEKELDELMKTSLASNLTNTESYKFEDVVEAAPESLLTEVAAKHGRSAYSLIEKILKERPSPSPYSEKALEMLCARGLSQYAQESIEKFDVGLFEKTIETHSLDYPYHAYNMAQNINNLNISIEEKNKLLDKVMQHQFVSADRDYSLATIAERYGAVIQKVKSIPKDSDYSKNNRDSSFYTEENMEKVRELIADGHLGFLNEKYGHLKHLAITDRDWFIEQAKKYNQEHLLLHLKKDVGLLPEEEVAYAKKLIDQDKEYMLAALTRVSRGSMFKERILDESIYNALVSKGYFPAFSSFTNLPASIAYESQSWDVCNEVLLNQSSFKEIDQKKLIDSYMSQGMHDLVASRVDFINPELHNELAHQLLEYVRSDWNGGLVGNLQKFNNLDPEIAAILIEKGKGSAVAAHPETFSRYDRKELAYKLLDSGDDIYLAHNLKSFKGLDHNDIARKIFTLDQERSKNPSLRTTLHCTLDNFSGLDPSIAFGMIRLRRPESVVTSMNSFDGLNVAELAESLCNQGDESIVLQYYAKHFTTIPESSPVYSEMDQAIRSNFESWATYIKDLPEASFFGKHKDFFVNDEKPTEEGVIFARLLKRGLFSMDTKDVDRFNQYSQEVGRFKSSTGVIEKYCQLKLEGKDNDAEIYVQEISKKADSLVGMNPVPESLKDDYMDVLRIVYPKRNYDTYSHIDSYEDRTKDLDKYVFDRNGYDLQIDGVLGYRIKEGVVANEKLIIEFTQKVEAIKNISTTERLDNFILERIPQSKSTTLEGRILEYFKAEGYTLDTMNVLLAYQLRDQYDEFVSSSADRTSRAGDKTEKDFILLDELANRYGDSMKETIKSVQEAVAKSSDRELFANSTLQEHGQTYESLATEILTDLEKIPRDKITNEIIQKKIAKTIKNTFQGAKDFQDRSTYFASLFSKNDLDNFPEVWNKNMDQLFAVADAYTIDMKKIQALQSTAYQKIQEEVSKYEEIREVDTSRGGEMKSSKERNIKGYFAKNKESAHARMVADICLAQDPNMLTNKDYFEFVLMDPDRQKCVGTTMLMSMNEPDGKKYLLYCPNPSVGLVSEVSAKKLYQSMTDRIKEFAKDNGFNGVLVDKTHGKSTNRAGLFQNSLDQSCLKDATNRDIIVNLKEEYVLGGGYKYKNGLQIVWKK